MTRLRRVGVIAAVTAALALTASPALAAPPPVPSGDQLVAMSCFSDAPLDLFVVDPATGTSTEIASAGFDGCGYAAAWDTQTIRRYGVEYYTGDLLAYDPATARFATVGAIADSGGGRIDTYDFAIDPDGNAFGIDADGNLSSIDLATGLATLLGDLVDLDLYTYGFSADPVTGTLYALSESGTLYEIDPDLVTATAVDTWPFPGDGDDAWGLAIDSAGTAWVVQNPGEDDAYAGLWSTPLATFGDTTEFCCNLVDPATGVAYDGWWVAVMPAIYPPQLANTGVDAAPLVAGGLGLLAVGALVVVAAARRSRRA